MKEIFKKSAGQLVPSSLMRTTVDTEKLAGLVVQIDQAGGLDESRPLVVTDEGDIISGNRRLLAALIREDLSLGEPITLEDAARHSEALLGEKDWMGAVQQLQQTHAKLPIPCYLYEGGEGDVIVERRDVSWLEWWGTEQE